MTDAAYSVMNYSFLEQSMLDLYVRSDLALESEITHPLGQRSAKTLNHDFNARTKTDVAEVLPRFPGSPAAIVEHGLASQSR